MQPQWASARRVQSAERKARILVVVGWNPAVACVEIRKPNGPEQPNAQPRLQKPW